MFGAARYPEAIVSSTRQFDFYSGGGIDMAFLGMGELDAAGNVNVSRLGSKVVGPGGFVDIAQNAKRLVFCGTFDAKGTDLCLGEGQLTIRRQGEVAKLVPKVREITFSADYARTRRTGGALRHRARRVPAGPGRAWSWSRSHRAWTSR